MVPSIFGQAVDTAVKVLLRQHKAIASFEYLFALSTGCVKVPMIYEDLVHQPVSQHRIPQEEARAIGCTAERYYCLVLFNKI